MECEQADVITAFLNGLLDDDEVVYIRLPNGQYAKLRKALYGLRRSPRLWYEELARYLATLGFYPIDADQCLFINNAGSIILAYVDDMIFITQNKADMRSLKATFFAQYKCRDLGPIHTYLGIRVRRDRASRSIELSMEPYIDQLTASYSRGNALPRFTPTDVGILRLQNLPDDQHLDDSALHRYQVVIGKLLYPASQLRVDIAFHVAFLARAMSRPTPRHYDYALQVVDYLNTTKAHVMTYKSPRSSDPNNLQLHGYSDASFADCTDRRSTSGYLFKLAGGTISHRSAKQRLITTSTTEAEYVAMATAAKEATWLTSLLRQIHYNTDDTNPVLLYGDNQPAIKLLHSEGHHQRTKHIDITYHYTKERVKLGKLNVQYVRTTDMAADGLTKPLERVAHERYLSQIGLSKPTIIATGTTEVN